MVRDGTSLKLVIFSHGPSLTVTGAKNWAKTGCDHRN